MDIKESLRQLKFDDKEIDVYLASLELGESTIVPITNKVHLPRTTVFHILERLNERKLVEIIQKNSRHLYAPYPPRNIVTLLKQEKEKLDGQISTLESSLPELTKLYHLSPFQPKVRFYQGIEIRKIYDEVLNMPIDESWYVGETNRLVYALGEDYMKKWVQKRIDKGIKSRSVRILEAEPKEEIFSGDKKFMRSIRYAPKGFSCPTHILIYADNVALITTGDENFGLVITSREFAESMCNWFIQLWKASSAK